MFTRSDFSMCVCACYAGCNKSLAQTLQQTSPMFIQTDPSMCVCACYAGRNTSPAQKQQQTSLMFTQPYQSMCAVQDEYKVEIGADAATDISHGHST